MLFARNYRRLVHIDPNSVEGDLVVIALELSDPPLLSDVRVVVEIWKEILY
jgi:hypothetical protein